VSERRSSGRGRQPAPPPREILASGVRAEDLPDVVRPGAAAVPHHDTTADPAVGPSGNAALATGLASFVIEAGRLPLRLTEAALESQAQAIEDRIARGVVPALIVPGAEVLKAQIVLLAGMIRSVSGSGPDRTSG
jgi:hypothetical protein